MIDLHTHTSCSDGSLSPGDLIKLAAKKGIRAISVTDHDTTDGIECAQNTARENNIEFISGVEVSSIYKNIEIHILGLFIDPDNYVLKNFLENMRAKRSTRNERMITLFKNEGYDINIHELKKISKGSVISRVHFAVLLVKKGYCSDIKHAFDNFLRPGAKTYVERILADPKDTLDAIKKAGGIASLAHPGEYKIQPEKFEIIIDELRNQGLGAIEAIYPTHSFRDTLYFSAIAEKYDLDISGGSDFHGQNRPDIDLGTGFGDLNVGYNILEKLKDRLNHRGMLPE